MLSTGKITRGMLINQATNEARTFLFNPQRVETRLTVNWEKHVAIAASHERLHFRNTSNATFTLELLVNRMIIAKRIGNVPALQRSALFAQIRKEFDDHRNFLLALCYPRGRANDPVRRSPPRALFLWPRFLALDVVVNSLSFTDEAFATNLEPIQFRAALELQEVRDFRLTSAMARRDGFRRPGGIRRGEILTAPKGPGVAPNA